MARWMWMAGLVVGCVDTTDPSTKDSDTGATTPTTPVDTATTPTGATGDTGTVTTTPVPTGVWSAAEQLYGTFVVGSPPEPPSLAVNTSGHAVALFLSTGDVRYAERVVGGHWSNDAAVRPNATGWPAEVGIGADETTAVAWFTYATEFTPTKLVASIRDPGGSFAAVQEILADASGYGALDVGVAADGTVTVVYGGATVAAVDHPPGGAWSAPAPISGAAGSLIDLAVNSAGDAVAAWVSAGALWTSYRPSGGAWEAAEQVSLGAATWFPSATIDDDGGASVGFLDGADLWVASRPAGGGWGPAENVSATGTVGATALAGSGQGALLAVWMVLDQGYHGTIWESHREVGGAWSSAVRVSAEYEAGNWPSAGYDNDGSVAVAGWVEDGYSTARVAVATPGAGWTWSTAALGHASWGGQARVGAGGQTADAAWADQLASNPNAGQILGAYWE